MKLIMGREYRSKMRRKASSSPRRARAVISCALCILAPARALNGLTRLTASIISASSSVRLVSGTRDKKVSAPAYFIEKIQAPQLAASLVRRFIVARFKPYRPAGRQKARGKRSAGDSLDRTAPAIYLFRLLHFCLLPFAFVRSPP